MIFRSVSKFFEQNPTQGAALSVGGAVYQSNLARVFLSVSIAFVAVFLVMMTESFARDHMKTGGITSQPIGHYRFCQQYAQDCLANATKTKAPKLTRKRWKEMVEVNAEANRNIEPITDQDLYGVEEHWTYPKSYGDCEDYVLLKRYMLMQRGWPKSSLLITVVKQENGEGHAVLTVRTSRADYILDNQETKIRQWNKTDYKFLKRQSVSHAGQWSTVNDHRNKVASY